MQCEICKAMGHPVRMEIVEILNRGEQAAASLMATLETSKVNLSKHVGLLLRAGIVEQRREGRQVHYRLACPEIHEACTLMRSILYRRLKQEERLVTAIASGGSWLPPAPLPALRPRIRNGGRKS
jgi:ArsR family transcriptional regulator